jgi:ATP-dependent exoDNAse (exonuclease V) beta subunit
LRIFAAQGETLGDALAYAEHLFNSQGSIQLMTGHKSKGLEFDTVFILDRDLIRLDEGQEKNLLYVCQTRAKDSLFYVSSDNFHDELGE